MRKKQRPSRKHFALRWLIVLMGVMLGLILSGIYCVLPSQTLSQILQEEGMTETEVMHYEWGKFAPMNRELILVSQNEKAIVLSSAHFKPTTGWSASSAAHVFMKGEEKDQHFFWTARRQSDSANRWVCLFGFVPTGGTAPTYKIGVADWNWAPDGNAYYQTEEEYVILGEEYFLEQPIAVTPTPTIPVEGGMLYLEQYAVDVEKFGYEDCDARVLMEQDGVWDEPHRWCISSMVG